MENISYVKLFNQTIDDFFNELIEVFPDETNIRVKYTLFQTIIKMNVKKPCHEFMTKSIPFLDQIARKDEQFFLGPEKPGFLNSLCIERLWTPDLSPVTKQAIWRYIQMFFIIGVNIIEMPPETSNLINYIIEN